MTDSERKIPSPQTANLLQRIRKRIERLPLGTKLVLPGAAVLVGAVLIYLLFFVPDLEALLETNIQISFEAQQRSLTNTVNSLVGNTESTVINLANSFEAREYLRVLSLDDAERTARARTAIEGRLVSAFSLTDIQFADMRLLDASGEQLIRVRVTSSEPGAPGFVMGKESLRSERSAPYFQALETLRRDQFYISTPSLAEPVGQPGVLSDLDFQVAAAIYSGNDLSGWIIGSIRPRRYLLQNFVLPFTEIIHYNAYLVDGDGAVLAYAQELGAVPVSVRDRADYLTLSVPEEIASRTGNLPLTEIGKDFYGVQLFRDPTGQRVNLDWRLIIQADADLASERLQQLTSNFLVRSTFVVGLGILLVALLARSLISPLRRVIAGAQRIAGGNLGTHISIDTEDEVGQLARVLNSMTTRLNESFGTMENRVRLRTRNIQMVADISRDAARSRDLASLLQSTVDAIRDRFGFYHAQVFLVDEAAENAVLVTSTGEAGKLLLERRHKLAIGSQSIIGQVTRKRRTFITLDTKTSEVPHRFNPILPLTRSEMALPLIVGDSLLGALDIQSVEPDAFGPDDIQTFQVLADSLAIAIDNARLLQEQNVRLAEIDALNRRLTGQSWDQFARQEAGGGMAYEYDLYSLKSAPTGENGPNGGAGGMESPIAVRGQVVGKLEVTHDPGLPLTDEDQAMIQAVSERVGLAIENIRLVEQTRNALKRVQELYEASRSLSAAGSLEQVYQTVAEQLSGFSYVDMVVFFAPHPNLVIDSPFLRYAHVWVRPGTVGIPFQPGSYIQREMLPAAWANPSSSGAQVVRFDEAMTHQPFAQQLFTSIGFRTAAGTRLSTPGRHHGMAIAFSRREEVFDEAFLQFFSALSDQLASVLDNRYLFSEAEAEAERNRALAQATQAATQIGVNFETGVDAMIRGIAPAANVDRWWYGRLVATDDGVHLERVTAAFEPASPLWAMNVVSVEERHSTLAEAARLGRPVIVNAPTEHPLLSALPYKQALAHGKHIVVPVRAGAAIQGILMLGRDVGATDMRDSDAQFAVAVANQIASAAENRRLFALAETERATLETILESLPTGVVVADSESGQITLSNPQARTLLGLDQARPYPLLSSTTGVVLDADATPLNRVRLTQEPVQDEEVHAQLPDGETRDLLVNAVPLMQGDRMQSVIGVFQDVSDLRELENVLQESLRETTTLYEISRAIAGENDLISILRVVGIQIQILYECDHLFVVLPETPDQKQMTFALVPDETGEYTMELEAPNLLPSGILKRDEFIMLTDLVDSPDVATHPGIASRDIQALISAPLIARARNIGWLVLAYNQPHDFSAEQVRTLGNIGDQTAIAAEGARLAEQTALALSTATLLYEASLNVTRADSIENALLAVRDQMRYFEPSRVDIFLVDPRREERLANWVIHWQPDQPEIEAENFTLAGAPIFTDWEFLECDAYFVDDIVEAPANIAQLASGLPNAETVHAQASVPMQLKGRVMGRLVMSFDMPHRFGRAEQQVMTTLADQVSVTLDNFLLVQQTQESLDETAILYQSSRAISGASAPEDQLGAIMDYAIQPIVSTALLVRLNGDSWLENDASIRVLAHWEAQPSGFSLQEVRFTRDQFPAWEDFSTETMIWAEDLDDPDKSTINDDSLYRTLGLRSVIILPLAVGSTDVGSLLFGSEEVWPYSERDARIYASLADLIATSLERQRLIDQTARRARQLQLSAQIASSAASILDLEELFSQTINLIKEGFEYDHVQVFRITEDGQRARVIASTGDAGRQLLAIGHFLPVGSRSVIGQVTSTGDAQIVLDTTDPRAVHRPNPYLPNTRAEMALPLLARNRILGALDVQSNEPGAFTREDVAVLSSLADQIAIAIDNAELFEIANKRADEMRFLFDVTTAATGTGDETDTQFDSVAALIMENLEATVASLLIADDVRGQFSVHTASVPDYTPGAAPNIDSRAPHIQGFSEAGQTVLIPDLATLREARHTTGRVWTLRLVLSLGGLLPERGSALIAPLYGGDSLVGIVVVGKRETNAFTQDSQTLMSTLATSLTAIVQNSRLLNEVRRANSRLLELDKLKNQFLANMSHELRTPLNSIIGFSRIILKGIDGPLTETQEQDLGTIYESGRHLLGLVNDILDQAKIEADRMEFSFAHFSMADLIRGVMSTAVGLVKDKPIQLFQEVPPSLPPVWGDEFRTRQSLLNLVSNAAKFTNQGSVTAAASVVMLNGIEMVQVAIRDTGIGIPADRLDVVFEPFQQVETSAARQYEGTGLGLPIARKMIERQGGRLWVESRLGSGSTFYLAMPTNPVPLPEETEGEKKG